MTDDHVWCVGSCTSMIAIMTAERSFDPQRELANDVLAMDSRGHGGDTSGRGDLRCIGPGIAALPPMQTSISYVGC